MFIHIRKTIPNMVLVWIQKIHMYVWEILIDSHPNIKEGVALFAL
jgi:hypothetical protein